MLYIKSTLHFVVGLNYLMTLFDTLQYLSLFAKNKQKRRTKAKKKKKQKKEYESNYSVVSLAITNNKKKPVLKT